MDEPQSPSGFCVEEEISASAEAARPAAIHFSNETNAGSSKRSLHFVTCSIRILRTASKVKLSVKSIHILRSRIIKQENWDRSVRIVTGL